jgi:hypothetical protein
VIICKKLLDYVSLNICGVVSLGIVAVDAFRKGLSDLSDLCGHVQEKFEVFFNFCS